MKIEKQVTSLDLSKSLKSLGVKQDSYFQWFTKVDDDGDTGIWEVKECRQFGSKGYCSAFTTTELGEMLPDAFIDVEDSLERQFELVLIKEGEEYKVYYEYFIESVRTSEFTEKIEANARAKMLIYLLENKLIPKENER